MLDNTRFFIYWNVRKQLFSVRWKGKVISHAYLLSLHDLKFKVSEQGRQRVLREQCKNVHAGVEAKIISTYDKTKVDKLKQVSYNPYRGPYFTLADGSPIHQAPAGLCWEGKVWVWLAN